MSERPDVEFVLRDWFDDGPTTMSDRVVDVVAERISRQPQRRTRRVLRRIPMNAMLKVAAALVAVVFVAVVGWNLLPGRSPGIGVPGATPTPSPTATPGASAAARPWWLAGTDGPCGEAPLPPGCAGELSAGTHTSGGLRPAVTYTVPAGWVNYRDWADYFSLFPDTPDNRSRLASGGDDPLADVLVLPLTLSTERCPDDTSPNAWSTARLGGAVADLSGADGERRVDPITIGPYAGHRVDIAAEPDWSALCPTPGAASPAPGAARSRVILLELGFEGQPSIVAIRLQAPDPGDLGAFVLSAMPIVETFRFEQPSPSPAG